MRAVEIIFWASLFILFFCYAGYGILLLVINKIRGPRKQQLQQTAPALPAVTLVVAIYNEKEILAEKIRNTLELDYPADLLKVIFITDGSVDGSDQLIRNHPSITLLHQPERRGKLAAIKRAMQSVDTPVVVFSDANSILNKGCILHIAAHYDDPSTGGVAGEKKIVSHRDVSAVGEVEGLYWQYESFMKKQDAAFHTVVGAAGELFSIRTALFRPLDDSIILDDFLISMQVCLQGYRIAYEPLAFAMESPSASLAEEEKRKVRISAGAYQSLGWLGACLNIFKHPLLSFQYISRRLLRWVICPLVLPVLLITNVLLWREPGSAFVYSVLFYVQLIFYALVIPGWLLVSAGKKAGWLGIPFYFVFMNYCLVKGFIRFIRKSQTVLWEKSARQEVISS